MKHKLLDINCPYNGQCDLLKHKTPGSISYKSLILGWCSNNYINCPLYIRLDEQKKEKEPTKENPRRLEEHLKSIIG